MAYGDHNNETSLGAKDEDEITARLELVNKERRVLGLKINLNKTKLMVIDRSNTTQLKHLQNRFKPG